MVIACSRVAHEYQLDGSTNGPWDCGRVTAGRLIAHGSRGLYTPETEAVGRRMENPRGTSTVMQRKKAVESYDNEMKRKGYKPLKYTVAGTFSATHLIVKGAGKDMLLNGIKRGEMADVTIHYGTLRATAPSYITKTTSFNGFHSVAAGGKNGWKKVDGVIWVRVLDPIAKRTRWWKFQWLWKSADGTWSTKGGRGWVGGLTKCSPKIPAKAPEPPTAEELELIALRDKVAELEIALGDAQDVIEEMQPLAPALPADLQERVIELAKEITAYEPPDTGQKPKAGATEKELA